MTQETGLKIAASLLKIKAVKISTQKPFTWTSGLRSPIYCDNRQTLSHPEIRTQIKALFSDLVKEKFPTADSIAGVATAGIPHGALIADTLQLPFLYVRSSAKGHGLENKIEGEIIPGSKVVVVEDLISTGKSSMAAVEALQSAGIEVLGVVAIFSYGFPAVEKLFEERKIPLFTLANLEDLLQQAEKNNYIHASDFDAIRNWRKDPENWVVPAN